MLFSGVLAVGLSVLGRGIRFGFFVKLPMSFDQLETPDSDFVSVAATSGISCSELTVWIEREEFSAFSAFY